MSKHTHELEIGEVTIPASSRTRRTRMTVRHRALVRETTLTPSNLILPLFVAEGPAAFRNPIASMPGVEQLGIDGILGLCESALKAGLGGIILFGIPEYKDEVGSEAYN